MSFRGDAVDRLAVVNLQELAKWPSELCEMERVFFVNDAPVARFGGRFDNEFSFGDFEQQVTLAHELVEKDHFGSSSNSADVASTANMEEPSAWVSVVCKDEGAGFATDDSAARFGGEFDAQFSFCAHEEQAPLPHEFALKASVGSLIDCAYARATGKFGNRFSSGDFESQSSRFPELDEKAKLDPRDDAAFVDEGMDRQISFGNLVEQAVWPSELTVAERVACVQGSVLGTVVCGSGARAARTFRQRVAEENGSNPSTTLPSRAQSTEELQPRTNVPQTAEAVDTPRRQSVQPELRVSTELTANAQSWRSVKPEPRAMPCASTAMMACAQARRSTKPTPRKRPGGSNNQRVEVADPAGWADGTPTGDGTVGTTAAVSQQGA